uniref:Galectin n=1 Tax=Hippocampus comes TaxID=109280 RepID=A0A3Q2XSZ5_HIPCM
MCVRVCVRVRADVCTYVCWHAHVQAVPFRGDIGGGMHPGRKLVVVAIVDSHPDNDVPFFPFIAGQPFKMEVECLSGGFRVFVDAQKLFDFQHRLAPLHLVDTLWIKGGVTITKLG